VLVHERWALAPQRDISSIIFVVSSVNLNRSSAALTVFVIGSIFFCLIIPAVFLLYLCPVCLSWMLCTVVLFCSRYLIRSVVIFFVC
jgi:hypothetical protein